MCLCVCLFVQFFDALPMVQKICQRYVWIAYNQARKMKLFQIRLEDEKNIKTQHHIYRKCLFVRHRCLFVCHTELPSYLILNTLCTLFQMFVCPSQFYFQSEISKLYALVIPGGRAGGAVGTKPASLLEFLEFSKISRTFKNF